MRYFNLAIIEQQASNEEFHPAVAELHISVGKYQLEIGKLNDAMDNFLQALTIIRMIFGNHHSKVAECLYAIGLIFEARADFEESINLMLQALSIKEISYNDDDDDGAFILVIVRRIGIIFASMGDADNAIQLLELIKRLILQTSNNFTEDILGSIFGYNTYIDSPAPTAAAAA